MALKFHAETPPFDDRIHLRMLLKGDNGERSVATGVKFVDLSPSHPYEQNPLLTMRASEAQDLMEGDTSNLPPIDDRVIDNLSSRDRLLLAKGAVVNVKAPDGSSRLFRLA